jgi:predicted aspartyl protease
VYLAKPKTIDGKFDESGRVLLPVTLMASDGFELVVDAVINLEFTGAIVVPEALARSIGWRCLGARRVQIGSHVELLRHYIGLMSIGGGTQTVVALGSYRDIAEVGHKLLSGRRLIVDFASQQVTIETSI